MSAPLSTIFHGDVTLEQGSDVTQFGWGDININRKCVINGTENSTCNTDGSLIVAGGVGITKTLNVHENLNVLYGVTRLTETHINTNNGPFTVTGGNTVFIQVGADAQFVSTAGNINLLAGSTADFITLDGNVDVTNNLVVQNDITATSGTVISNTAEIAGMNMFEDSSGDQFFTTDAGPLILQPFEGSEIQLDSAEVVIPNGRTFKIKDADGKTVFQIDGSNDGLVNSEQMQIDDVFIHDNVVEVNVEDQDFILKAGNPSSAAAEDPQIIMQSEVTILRDLKVEGADAKVIIDQELELNADTEASIEAYTGNLNLRVNNLGDSTVNTINLHGSVNSYGYFYIDHDLTVARTVETNEVITNKHLYDGMLSEVRGGTLVSQFTSLKKGREDINDFISWTPDDINVNINKPHFYHPVK